MEPTSSGQHVLMKDQTKIKKAIRYTTIVVNSRDRHYISYPNSNHFRYTLRRPLTNVLSVELVNGVIPGFLYNINDPWNSFTFYENPTSFTVTLTPGYYTESQLATELQTQLNAIPGIQSRYTVTLNPQTRRIQVTSSHAIPFSFLFYSGIKKDDIDLTTFAILSINTPSRLLGFGLSDYSSDTSNTINAPLPMDIDNFLNRIYLHIDADGKNLSRMEFGAGRQDCFHIFYLTPGSNNYIYLDKETDRSMYTSSPAPLARVSNLEISLRDEFNRPLDINYREVSLVFEIAHLE
jgi:hypothetical protein